MNKNFLSAGVFKQVVDAMPLVSINLLIHDTAGRVLLGNRNNLPLQGVDSKDVICTKYFTMER